MNTDKNFGFVKFEYTKHALQKADERDISLEDVEYTIEYGEVVAGYPDDNPYPSYLYLCEINSKPVHVCFAVVQIDICRVITVYRPSLLIFENDFKTKRKT